MAVTVQVSVDCADPAALSRFWAEALGYEVDAPPKGFDSWDAFLDAQGVPAELRNEYSACSDPDGRGTRLFFHRVPEPKAGKNRLHLDVRAAPGLEGEARMARLRERAAELEGIGATRIREAEPEGFDAGFIVMADPEGNEFCLD